MAWFILVVSGILETVWAAALGEFSKQPRPVPVVVFVVASIASFAGLAYALRSLPIGTGYAVWVGIGAVGTVIYGIAALGEPAGMLRLSCVGLIVAGVVGLRLVH